MKNQSELMRQHHAIKTGVSIGKEFTDLERHDGVETIASVFGRKEKCYLPKKNIAI